MITSRYRRRQGHAARRCAPRVRAAVTLLWLDIAKSELRAIDREGVCWRLAGTLAVALRPRGREGVPVSGEPLEVPPVCAFQDERAIPNREQTRHVSHGLQVLRQIIVGPDQK